MYIFHLNIQHGKSGEKSQEPGSVYKIEMKLYVISMKVDIPLMSCQKNFFFL